MAKKITTIVGIDPGLKGGIAAIQGSDIVLLSLMPLTRKRKWSVDGKEIREMIKDLDPERTKVYIEKVNAMPHQGVTSMFSFGKGYGIVIGVFESLGFDMVYVTPNVWKPKIVGKGRKHKKYSIKLAKKLFPEANLKPGRKIKDQDGLAEALLIAVYGGRIVWK